MSLYLGPLGGLVRMRPPRQDVDMSATRYGGTHTAISGRKTVDVTGHRATFTLTWHWLTQAEMDWFEALHFRHIPGPLRLLLDGHKRNRLSRSAASTGYGARDTSGVQPTAGSLRGNASWPGEAAPAGQSVVWSSWAVGSYLRLDRDQPAPVLPGETVTASIYVRSARADGVRLVLDHYGPDGYSGRSDGDAVTLTPDVWQRLTVTATPGADGWAVAPAVAITGQDSPTAELLLAAAQVESGETATAWSLGGGAPVVVVDQMPVTAPRHGFSHPELTLLEV